MRALVWMISVVGCVLGGLVAGAARADEAGPGAEPEQEAIVNPRSALRERYAFGLAARPLVMPNGLLELAFGYHHVLASDGATTAPNPTGDAYGVRAGLRPGLELRDLGVYGVVGGGHDLVPELGLGGAVTSVGYASVGGIILGISLWVDLKEHLDRRVAVLLREQLELSVSSPGQYKSQGGLDLIVDVLPRLSLVAGASYARIVDGRAGSDDIVLGVLTAAVQLASWLELRVNGGPQVRPAGHAQLEGWLGGALHGRY